MNQKKGGAFAILFWLVLGLFIGIFLTKALFCS